MNHLTQCPEQIAIDELTRRRLLNQVGEPLTQSPQSLEQAFSWQQAVAAQMAVQGRPVVGWKCALPSAERWGLAPIFQLHTGGQVVLPAGSVRALAEPEFAWRLRQDLLPGQTYSRETLRQALQCHLALEIIFDRFVAGAEVDYYSRLADGLLNHSLWLGPPLPQAPAQLPLRWQAGAEAVAVEGIHPNADAFAPAEWLVAFLLQRGMGLYAGQVITTGSLNGLWRLPVNQPVSIEYGDMARIELKFTSEVYVV